MAENIYRFISKRQIEDELHQELLTKLDRCMEICLILESQSSWKEEYRSVGEYVYRAFTCIEDSKQC